VLAFTAFPKGHRAVFCSTNPPERVNSEIERRTDVVDIFPNDATITCLVGAIISEQNNDWAVQRRYMNLETLAPINDAPTVSLPAIAA
jgi:transposase-like protein